MKVIHIVAYGLFILCFSLLIVTSTARFEINSVRLYENGFHKYQVSQTTGIDEIQLEGIARRLIDYFNSRAETPQMKVIKNGEEFELFHDYELVHLQDVKRLFQVNYWLQVASLAYVVVYVLLFLLWRKGRWQDLVRGIRRGCVLTLCFIALIGFVSFFGFEQIFIQFHYLVFGDPSSSPWVLDPGKDYLIMLFPEPFWQDVAILGGVTIAAQSLLLGAIAWGIPFVHRRRKGICVVSSNTR